MAKKTPNKMTDLPDRQAGNAGPGAPPAGTAPTASDEQLEAMRDALRGVERAEKDVETAKEQKKDKDGDLVAAKKELRRTVADIAGPPGLLFDKGQGRDGE